MGIIMSLGVSVSNAVLLVNQAEYYRRHLALKPANAARLAASSRLRPVLMTAAAMLAGMLPMAMGLGDGAEQVDPLGRAVIGGVLWGALAEYIGLNNALIISAATSLLGLPITRNGPIELGNEADFAE